MTTELLDILWELIGNYGVELIGSLFLAISISMFYTHGSAKEGLQNLAAAFYALFSKNILLILIGFVNAVLPQYAFSAAAMMWINLLFLACVNALLFASAFQMMHVLITSSAFIISWTLLLVATAFLILFNPLTSGYFVLLPDMYFSAGLLVAGLALVMMKQTRQTQGLRALGLGLIVLGLYYLQSNLSWGANQWIYGAAIYTFVLVQSLFSLIGSSSAQIKRLEQTLETEHAKQDLILDTSPFPVLITRLVDDSVLHINPVAKNIFGITDSEVPTFHFTTYFANPQKRVELLTRIKRETVIQSFEVQIQNPKTGAKFWLDLSTRIIDLDGELALYTTFKDTTENKNKEEELFNQASTDPLTGLFNRRQFELLAKAQVSLGQRHRTPYCVIMLDIDHFKMVNDTYGHDAGDEVLKHLALVLKSSLRDSDILARYGGEEFVIFLPHTTPENAYPVAQRIRLSVERAQIVTQTETLQVTVSVGISSTPFGELYAQVKEADTALYESKTQGRNRVTIYKPDMKGKVEK